MNGFPARMSGILTIFALAMLVATPAFSTEPLPSASLAAEGAVGMIDFPDDGVFAPVPAHRHRNPDGGLGGWVADTAYVGKDARVSGNAMVFGNAWVAGNAQVYGNAKVFGNAWVAGNALVFGDAVVLDDAQVSGDAVVLDDARVSGNAKVFGNARVSGNARVFGSVVVAQSPLSFSVFSYLHITVTETHILVGNLGTEVVRLIPEWENLSVASMEELGIGALVPFRAGIYALAKAHQTTMAGGK